MSNSKEELDADAPMVAPPVSSSEGAGPAEGKVTGDSAPSHRRSSVRHFGLPPPSHWSCVERALRPLAVGSVKVHGVPQIQEVMTTYLDEEPDLSGLRAIAAGGQLPPSFFSKVVPFMAHAALQLPHDIPVDLPMLGHNVQDVVDLSRRQVLVLLANMFLCTFPRLRRRRARKHPENNFLPLLASTQPQEMAKLQCYLHYFARVSGVVVVLPGTPSAAAKSNTSDRAPAVNSHPATPPVSAKASATPTTPPVSTQPIRVGGHVIDDDSHPELRPGTPMASARRVATTSVRTDGSPGSTGGLLPASSSPPPGILGKRTRAHLVNDEVGEADARPALHAMRRLPDSTSDDVDMMAELGGTITHPTRVGVRATTPPLRASSHGGAGASRDVSANCGAGVGGDVGRESGEGRAAGVHAGSGAGSGEGVHTGSGAGGGEGVHAGSGAGGGAGSGGGGGGGREKQLQGEHETALTALQGRVCFRRVGLQAEKSAWWEARDDSLSKVTLVPEGGIEDAEMCLQVDFANRFIGGGVIVGGCVQEEIRFAICPELTVSMLFCAFMKDHEVLFLTGAERFCDYKVGGGSETWCCVVRSGAPHIRLPLVLFLVLGWMAQDYAFRLKFGGGCYDPTPRSSTGSVLSCIVAMDAQPYAQIGYVSHTRASQLTLPQPRASLLDSLEFDVASLVPQLSGVPDAALSEGADERGQQSARCVSSHT